MGDYYEPRGYLRPSREPKKVIIQITLPDGTGAVGQIEPRLLTGDYADDSQTIANAAREVAYIALKNSAIKKLGGTPEE